MTTYKLQQTSIWKFSDRGKWATHKGDYRGNWSPHIPKNLILKYTQPTDIVLDPFLGSGTTLIECKLLNRHGVGIDVNLDSLKLSKNRLNFNTETNSKQTLIKGDARNLSMLNNNSIDFVCTHPPYSNIIKYSLDLKEDLSRLDYIDFLREMYNVSKECFRVLKPNHYCAFMMGDIRKNSNVIPLGFLTMQTFLNSGFTLKEIIIKEQINCKSTDYWQDKHLSFYLLAHEYIFVLKK